MCTFRSTDMAPPRPPLPSGEVPPPRPPPPETDDEDEMFMHAPQPNQPIMVSSIKIKLLLKSINCFSNTFIRRFKSFVQVILDIGQEKVILFSIFMETLLLI